MNLLPRKRWGVEYRARHRYIRLVGTEDWREVRRTAHWFRFMACFHARRWKRPGAALVVLHEFDAWVYRR